MLSPAEKKVYDWAKLDPTRPFCSKDITELPEKYAKGTARNITSRLHELKLIEIYCKDRYTFFILASADQFKVKKPMTVSHMGGSGLKHVQINFGALLDSMPWEELCKIHHVRLIFTAEGLYELFLENKSHQPDPVSKDISFGSFIWSKYRSLEVTLHHNGMVSLRLDCGNCPVEASAVGFACMAAFLGGVRNELLNAGKTVCSELNEEKLPQSGRLESCSVALWARFCSRVQW